MSPRPIPIKANGALYDPGGYKNLAALYSLDIPDGISIGNTWAFDFVYSPGGGEGWWPMKPVAEFALDHAANDVLVKHSDTCALMYYVDSVAWDGDISTMNKSGDGTESNPWRNLNYAIESLIMKAYYLRIYACNMRVQIRIKGTINYAIANTQTDITLNHYYPYGSANITLSPWDYLPKPEEGDHIVGGGLRSTLLEYRYE